MSEAPCPQAQVPSGRGRGRQSCEDTWLPPPAVAGSGVMLSEQRPAEQKRPRSILGPIGSSLLP